MNIDYSGSIDGEKFDGGTASSQSVQAGSAQFIDDFLTQIIGHTPGETFDVEVTFPDPYENNPDLAGKDAVFEVTINYIEGEDVTPEFSDDFVKENLTAAMAGKAPMTCVIPSARICAKARSFNLSGTI